jgi:hypothetical protein
MKRYIMTDLLKIIGRDGKAAPSDPGMGLNQYTTTSEHLLARADTYVCRVDRC